VPASDEQVRDVIERYVQLVATGTADEIVALYADGATVEDPVGSEPLTTRDQLHAFYTNLEGLEQEARVVHARVCAGQAAFLFELRTKVGESLYELSPIDVMTFDDDARITSMRAFWGAMDMVVS
jgi:steroid delta-isomerase